MMRSQSPDAGEVLGRMVAELEGWQQFQLLQDESTTFPTLSDGQPEERCLLNLDMLAFADAHPQLWVALLSDPASFVRFVRERAGKARASPSTRLQIRLYNVPAHVLASPASKRDASLLQAVCKVAVLQNSEQRVWSRLVRCCNQFCYEGKEPFTITEDGHDTADCPHCKGTLAEDCRARVMYEVRHVTVVFQAPSLCGIGRPLLVRLEDDLAQVPLRLGQQLRLCGFLAPANPASAGTGKCDPQVILVALGMSANCRVAQLEAQTASPRILQLPCFSPVSASTHDAAAWCHDLALSLLPGLPFCTKAKLTLLLSLISANGNRTMQGMNSASDQGLHPSSGQAEGACAPVFGLSTPRVGDSKSENRPASPTGSIAGSVVSRASHTSSSTLMGAEGDRKAKTSRERINVIFCGGHQPIVKCIIGRLRTLARSAGLPMSWIKPSKENGGLCPKFQVGNEGGWKLENSQLLHANGGMALFSDSTLAMKSADLAVMTEILERSSLHLGRGKKEHMSVEANISFLYLLEGPLASLPGPKASSNPLVRHFDLVVDMHELPEAEIDRAISSYYMQDENFLDSIHAEPPPFSDLMLSGVIDQASRITVGFSAQAIRLLGAFHAAARKAISSSSSNEQKYCKASLERLIKAVAKLRLSQIAEVCDVVLGINFYEESRVAKGIASLLGFSLRSNGRQNVELLDEDPIQAYCKLEGRILSICHSYGTLAEDSSDDDAVDAAGLGPCGGGAQSYSINEWIRQSSREVSPPESRKRSTETSGYYPHDDKVLTPTTAQRKKKRLVQLPPVPAWTQNDGETHGGVRREVDFF